MKNLITFLLGIFTLMFFLGSCKVYRNVENFKPSYSKEEKAGEFISESLTRLKAGDNILVRTKSGETYFLDYNRLNGTNLMGTLWLLNEKKIKPTENVEIPIAEIEEVRVKKSSPALLIILTSTIVIFIVAILTAGAPVLGGA